MKKIPYLLFFCFTSLAVHAEDGGGDKSKFEVENSFKTAKGLALAYGAEAKKSNPNSKLSAEAGRAFYTKEVTAEGFHVPISCSSCHTDNPANEGKHIETKKPIKPLAISANPSAFSSVTKVEKNFKKHCTDLYGKDCSAQDKGDYITYLLSK